MDEEWWDLSDVAMGAYDGVEVCEFIDNFLLEKINKICNKSNIGLYRYDGLSNFRNKKGSQVQKIKNEIAKIIKRIRPRNNTRKYPKNRKLSRRNFELKRLHF